MSRSGNNLYTFFDGQLLGTDVWAGSINYVNNPFCLGAYGEPLDCFNGHIDEFRFSKGIAKWTSSFTLPTREYVYRMDTQSVISDDDFTIIPLTITSFDPIRRQIARIALENLLLDGRIQPAKIEKIVEKAQQDINKIIKDK